MKWLKDYNEFERGIVENLGDILIPINDELLWKAQVWQNASQRAYFKSSDSLTWWVIIQTRDEDPEWELEGQTPSQTIIDSVERAISYMKSQGFSKSKITFEEDETDKVEVISTDDFADLDVWPNQFIRVEFYK